MESTLDRSQTKSTRTLILVLLGIGGGGKTQLALEFCEEHREGGRFGAILWFDVSSRSAAVRGVRRLAKKLLPQYTVQDATEVVDLVREAIASWGFDWLMVLDGFDDPSNFPDIMRFVPHSRRGHIIVTTRHGDCQSLGPVLRVESMEKDEALRLLLPSIPEDEQEVASAHRLLQRLDYLALAIDQARRYVSYRQLSPSVLLKEFDKRKIGVLMETPIIWQYRRCLPPTNDEVRLSVLTTWEPCLSRLDFPEGYADRFHSALLEIAELCIEMYPNHLNKASFVSIEPIDEEVLMDTVDLQSQNSYLSAFVTQGNWNRPLYEAFLVEIHNHSLAKVDRSEAGYFQVTIPFLVCEWLLIKLGNQSRRSTIDMLVNFLVYLSKRNQKLKKKYERLEFLR